MRIGFILDGNFKTDNRVINEARILEDRGHTVFVLNPGIKNQPVFESYSQGIKIVRFGLRKKWLNWFFALENIIPFYDLIWSSATKSMIGRYNIESVHAHDLYLARAGHMAAKKRKIPLVVDLHENYPAAVMEYKWANRFPSRIVVRPQQWGRKEREYLSYASSIIVLSNTFKTDLVKRYPLLNPTRVFIYPNVPDADSLLSFPVNDRVFEKNNRLVLFYFGVISRRRGIITSIEALRKLLPRHPYLHLLLIGPVDRAEKAEFEQLICDRTVKENITYFPWKDIGELPSYLACSDICLSPLLRNPQHDSGVANKIFQYMLFEKPLLVSDCLPQKEIIEETMCGRYFRNNDADDMARVIEEMISSSEDLVNMGKKGKKAVIEKYNTVVQGEAIEASHLSAF